jgi:hypothetical protein
VLDAARALPKDHARVRAKIETALAPGRLPETIERLHARVERLQDEAKDHRSYLTAPEQAALDAIAAQMEFGEPDLKDPEFAFLSAVAVEVAAAENPAGAAKPEDGGRLVFPVSAAAVLLLVPLGWAGFAFVFRGGLAFLLAGITLVRADGRRAGRLRCAVRELIVWTPFTAVLLLTLWVQYAHPEMVLTRTVLWLFGVAMIPLYAVIALRDPVQPPQDRLAGTFLVPE